MNLRFIDRGTPLTITRIVPAGEPEKEYPAKFYETVGVVSFLAESEEICKDFTDFKNGAHFNVDFFRGHTIYSFKGKVKCLVTKGHLQLIQIDQISDIGVFTRRKSPRHEIMAAVTVYNAESFGKSDIPLISNTIFDVSSEGLCFLSNRQIKSVTEDTLYILEFTLNKNDKFAIPSRLVRSGNSPQSVQFKYDYGFVFDFSNNPDEKSRLITSMFQHKMSDTL